MSFDFDEAEALSIKMYESMTHKLVTGSDNMQPARHWWCAHSIL